VIFFRRRRNDADAAPQGEAVPEPEEATPAHGPWDLEDMPELGRRVDVGALRVPARPGMQLRMELDPTSRRIVAVNIVYQGSAMQLQAFAAPKSLGIWEELRAEISESIGKQGGAAEEREGTTGPELLARLPVRTKDGRTGVRPVRFLGIDGPRWFLRAVVSGKAAVESEAFEHIEEILRDVVVVRGEDPRPPRELLPLHLPGKPGEVVAPRRPDLDLDGRSGPEITEVG